MANININRPYTSNKCYYSIYSISYIRSFLLINRTMKYPYTGRLPTKDFLRNIFTHLNLLSIHPRKECQKIQVGTLAVGTKKTLMV